jgi:hypothetical protein
MTIMSWGLHITWFACHMTGMSRGLRVTWATLGWARQVLRRCVKDSGAKAAVAPYRAEIGQLRALVHGGGGGCG